MNGGRLHEASSRASGGAKCAAAILWRAQRSPNQARDGRPTTATTEDCKHEGERKRAQEQHQ